MSDQPLVSIIIPTLNSESTLAKCLESIGNQTYKNIEIIVVDNYSTDKTVEFAEKNGAKIFILNSERVEAKNFGASKSMGKYVFFIDSDMELMDKVVEECVILAEGDSKSGGLIIPERSVGNNFWVEVRDFERSFYKGTVIESARFFRRDLIDKANGFDEDVICLEESTLPQKVEKLGYSVKSRIKSEILHHEYKFSLYKWLKKKYYYGKTAFTYIQKYHEYGKKQSSLIYRFSLFLKDRRFRSKPSLAIGVLTLKLLEFFSLGLGFLVGIFIK